MLDWIHEVNLTCLILKTFAVLTLYDVHIVSLLALLIWFLVPFNVTPLTFIDSLLSVYEDIVGSPNTQCPSPEVSRSLRKSDYLGYSLPLLWLLLFSGQNLEILCSVFNIKCITSPSWCGSVDWVLACELKGCWFNSQSGHMPGLQTRSPFGAVQEATTHWCFFPSLSPSLRHCLKINNLKNKIKIKNTKWHIQ